MLTGLQMTLVGVSSLSGESQRTWEKVTQDYVRDFFKTNPDLGVDDVTAVFKITNQNAVFRRQLRGRRQLQEQLVLTYDENMVYRSTDATAEYVAEVPFLSAQSRTDYIRLLRNSGDDAWGGLVATSNLKFPEEPSSGGGGGLSTPVIIGIAVGGAVLLALGLGGGAYMNRRSKRDSGSNRQKDTPPAVIPTQGMKGDEVSTLAEPSKVVGAGDVSVGYGDQSVATVDYDYSKAYGGAADHSVSSAGGTFGSNIHSGGNQGGDDSFAGGGPATLGSFDDQSYGDSAFDGNDPAAMREDLIDVYAPPGKLGVVIDTPDDGAPVVHAIKESSVIADKLQVGDKLVAVDDEDVRAMTAIKVSKLISRKSSNNTRKLSIIRTTAA